MTINKKLYSKLSVYQPCWPWFETSEESESIKDAHPGILINFKIPLYHLNEIYITGRAIVYALEHDEEKKSFCQIRLSIWKIILEEIENTLNKE